MSRATPRFRRQNAPLPAAPANTFALAVIGSIENQMTVNTFFFSDGGAALTAGSEAALANAWIAANKTLFLSLCSSDWTMVTVKVQCLTSPTRIPAYVQVNAAGTALPIHDPTTVCVTVDRYSLVKGQAGRGRVSMPAVPSGWTTASSLNATGQAAYAAGLSVFNAGFVGGAITYVQVVVSRKNKVGPALGASPVQGAVVRTVLGSCRRRKLGRGK